MSYYKIPADHFEPLPPTLKPPQICLGVVAYRMKGGWKWFKMRPCRDFYLLQIVLQRVRN